MGQTRKSVTETEFDDSASAVERPKVGLALGAGGARGWAHIGVIQSLQKIGIEPDIVTGTSVGALVGAAYVMDDLDSFSDWITQLRWRDVVGFFDISLSGGFIEGKKLFDFFREHYKDIPIEQMQKPYTAVATRLDNGHEIWLRDGSVLNAVRASIAVPGFFTPVYHQGHWLVDGGLVNPVPVSVCRVLGADIVIAVSPAARTQLPLKSRRKIKAPTETAADTRISDSLITKVKHMMRQGATSVMNRSKPNTPSVFDVVGDSIDIMQTRVMRSRMAGDPPDIFLEPRMPDIKFLDFHRGREAIDAGHRVVDENLQQLQALKTD